MEKTISQAKQFLENEQEQIKNIFSEIFKNNLKNPKLEKSLSLFKGQISPSNSIFSNPFYKVWRTHTAYFLDNPKKFLLLIDYVADNSLIHRINQEHTTLTQLRLS